MSRQTRRQTIEIRSLIPSAVTVRRTAPAAWTVAQRRCPGHDNAQAATWLRIENTGPARRVSVRVRFSDANWMQFRGFGYLRTGDAFDVLRGEVSGDSTRYTFSVPRGASRFGPFPWYDNADADRFLEGFARNRNCEVRVLGRSGEGREIKALTIQRGRGHAKRQPVLVLAREHGNESAGSFAVEAAARYLLGRRAPAEMLRRYAFHLIPVINPDGVAAGRKLTRLGPVKETDIYQGAFTSDDPTCRVLRETVLAMRPACIVSYHSYLQPSPACMFFDKADGMAMLDYLLDVDNWIRAMGPVFWKGPKDVKSVWHVNRMPRDYTLWGECVRLYRPVINMPELPWHGRTIEEMNAIGLASFLAAMHALGRRG